MGVFTLEKTLRLLKKRILIPLHASDCGWLLCSCADAKEFGLYKKGSFKLCSGICCKNLISSVLALQLVALRFVTFWHTALGSVPGPVLIT